jgi:hypothetical protein
MVIEKRPISGLCPDSTGIIEYGDLEDNKNNAEFDEKILVYAPGAYKPYPRVTFSL